MAAEPKAYAAAGVDIDLADRLLERLKPALARAKRPESIGSIGGFGGLFDLGPIIQRYQHPVLVSSTDSVGTKVKVATLAQEFRFIGADIVNHCCNDVAVCGAEPLYFLDYYATDKLREEAYVTLLEGVARACVAAHVALVGGETAELPGVYQAGEFDLVGTIVGVVDRAQVLTGAAVRPGDVLIGLASSGLHTNGYSLARKIIFEQHGLKPGDSFPGTTTRVGQALLAPHVNYAPFLLAARSRLNSGPRADSREGNQLFAAAHITGSGFTGNIPRVLPASCDAVVHTSSWSRPPIFDFLAAHGGVSFAELHEVFNMGIGLVVIAHSEAEATVLQLARDHGHEAVTIGQVAEGTGTVRLIG